MKQLTDDQVVSILKNFRKDAFGAADKELTLQRIEAMDRYHGRPLGDEEEGYSKFVTKDLAEAVDWAMPSILRPFIQSGTLAEFKATNQGDEAQVQQESDYVNYIIMEENGGFLLLHDVFKDALVLKNGYCKHWWNEETDISEREWTELSEIEAQYIMQPMQSMQADGTKVEFLEPEQNENGTIDLKAKITRKIEGVKIMAVPPEELRIAKTCRGSLQDADFVEHCPRMTYSELVKMGISKEWLDSLDDMSNDDISTQESGARDSVTDEIEDEQNEEGNIDKSMREMDYAEAYVRMDYDGDGVAELRKIITVNNKIPPGDDWNEIVEAIPFTGGSPKRMPHRHIGESFQDDICDLAEQNTTLVRQMFDNVYRTNHNQWAINGRVDEGEFIDQGPSAVFRVDGREPIAGSIEPIKHEPIAQHLLPIISFVEEKKKTRTGVNENDLDPNILKNVANGAYLETLNRKSQKIEMTTRMFGETFVKELVINVHAIILKHQTKPKSVKIDGQYAEVNPSTWMPRKTAAVKVGLGTGNGEDRIRKLTMLKDLQAQFKELGLVGDEESHKLYIAMAKELGESNPEKYIITPSKENPKYQEVLLQRQQAAQGPQQNPLADAEKVKGQFGLEKEKMRLQFKAQADEQQRQFDATIKQMSDQQSQMLESFKSNKEHEHKMHLIQADIAKNMANIASREDIAAFEGEVRAAIAGLNIDAGKKGIGAGLQESAVVDSSLFNRDEDNQ